MRTLRNHDAGTKGTLMYSTAAESDRPPLSVDRSYIPPVDTASVKLSAALRDSGRFPESRQLDILGRASTPKDDTQFWYAGDISLLSRPCVAIVGTRQVSEKGRARTARLARGLVDAGIVVVSGLAYGVDAMAHRATIDAGGRTIAVIGTPLDKASPSENAALQEEIYSNHLLISQFPVGQKTSRANFPQRNKLMATLADATVVIEASDTSGTLHQAAECTRIGRWLFIARSVVEDKSLTWPAKFLKYATCLPLDDVGQIVERVCSPRAS